MSEQARRTWTLRPTDVGPQVRGPWINEETTVTHLRPGERIVSGEERVRPHRYESAPTWKGECVHCGLLATDSPHDPAAPPRAEGE